jgi:ketosteroid isomerase-like protein
MTASHRPAAVRTLTVLAVMLSIWISGARAARAQTRIIPLGEPIPGSLRPDIVVMHPGTKDVWNARPVDGLLAAFSRLDHRADHRRHDAPWAARSVGSFVQTHGSTASAITYRYALGARQVLSVGTRWIFAAQTRGGGVVHRTSGDRFTRTYTAGGATFTTSGHL